jgi:ectoine hydroxylase-related dioxygenase (phytanoyl-CoA dioxygenase family)
MQDSGFDETGYTVVRGMLTPEECALLKEEAMRVLNGGDGGGHGVFVGMAANSDLFREFAAHPRILEALEPILGEHIEFLSDKIVFKSATMDFASPWHQDWTYWKGIHKVSVWIALDAADESNGCLKLLPGSHKSLVVHDGDASDGKGFGNRLNPDTVDESLAISAPCAIGDAVIFHDLTLHASHPNLSGKDRWTLISTYRSAAETDLDYSWAVVARVVRGQKRSIAEI